MVFVGVDTNGNTAYDTQLAPVFVTPTAPALKLLTPTVLGTTGSSKGLEFQMSGLFPVAGATVTIFADGKAVKTEAVTDSTMTITIDSGTALANGLHTFTASQDIYTADIDNIIPNRHDSSNLQSALSVPVAVTVDNVPPQVVNLTASQGTKFTLRRLGANVELLADASGKVLLDKPISVLSSVQITGAAKTAEQLTIDLFTGGVFTLPLGVVFTAGTGAPPDTLLVSGPGTGTTFNLTSTALVVAGLNTNYSGVGTIKLIGGAGNDHYTLTSSPANVVVSDSGGFDALDFSGDSAGVTVNFALTSGQAQKIAPWGKTLSILGTIEELVGSNYNDVLTGGSVTNIIRGGGGNDLIRAGTGNAVLLGGSGNDTLYASNGACVLIAGSGTSTLYGGSGSNLLIGGTTSYDANDQALLAIVNQLSVWRMTAVGRGRVSTGPVTGAYPLILGTTVFDPGTKDVLVGGSGINWFLAGAHDTVDN